MASIADIVERNGAVLKLAKTAQRLTRERVEFRLERDRCREMFQETRRRMCERMGVEPGKSWAALEMLATERTGAIRELVDALRPFCGCITEPMVEPPDPDCCRYCRARAMVEKYGK